MAKLIETYDVCTDCLEVIVNGDYSGLDYYLSPEEAEAKANEINEGIATLQADGGYLVDAGEEPDEFSTRSCDCCEEYKAGTRHEVSLIK